MCTTTKVWGRPLDGLEMTKEGEAVMHEPPYLQEKKKVGGMSLRLFSMPESRTLKASFVNAKE